MSGTIVERPRVTHDCMDAGGTIPGMELVESSLERRPRAMPEAIAEDAKTEASIQTHRHNIQ